MKTILVTTDFSEHSHTTVRLAAAMAQRTQGHLILVHSVPLYPASEPLTTVDIGLSEQYESSKSQLEKQAESLRQPGLSIETVLESGSLGEMTRQLVKEKSVELVVVGRTETSTGWLAQLFGSQASDLVEALDVPVLMVPPGAVVGDFHKILYATQLEFDERAVLRRVFAWAKLLGASVQLVKLNVPFEPNIHRDEDYLHDIKKTFAGESFEFSGREAETVSGGLSEAAAELGADVLVLTSHHRSFLDQLINPSKARQVLLQSPVPTMVFPLERV